MEFRLNKAQETRHRQLFMQIGLTLLEHREITMFGCELPSVLWVTRYEKYH